ncbi:MAG: PorP/SprF family type IX secretion system membrane protein [Flavobacteriales bacterium]|nr:PorP/SprF family type IX secretion system membrane protein [Flavobacteriales bacterium]
MRNSKIYLGVIAILLCGFGVPRVSAQDIHFSQFSSSPLTLNPGATGAFNGKFRVAANIKDQWTAFDSPFKTRSLSFDMPFMEDIITDGSLAGGIHYVRDIAGDLDVGTNQIGLSLAANKSLDRENNVSIGIQAGFAQWAIGGDGNTRRWDSEFDPSASGGYTNNGALESTIPLENFSYGDFSTGIFWRYMGNIQAHAGLAVYHVNRPSLSFLDSGEKLNSKLAFHGGAEIFVVDELVSVMPQLLFLKQGPQSEFNVGGLVKYRLKQPARYTGEIEETAVYLGGWYRVSDAFIVNARFDYKNFALGVSYDINISDFDVATSKKGGLEFSLIFINPGESKRKTASPLM